MEPRTAFARRETLQLIDVREPDEWSEAHIEDSQHIPMDHIAGRLDRIDQERPVVTVCRTGRRSAQVADYLRESGFQAENLDGGLEQWTAEGLPVVRPAYASR